ncbi:MAG: trypsin-like peptidase domain-containing protein [Mariprofundaceae bacterium]|nr:trypsin-like peptidase domain-containing protein [Mariprofundaceae bacterium]
MPASKVTQQQTVLKVAAGSQASVITLSVLPASAKQATSGSNKGVAMQIGVERDLPTSYAKGLSSIALNWQSTNDGGMAAVIEVQDPGALAVRLGLEIESITTGTQIRFYGAGIQPQVYGPYPQSGLNITYESLGSLFWSPVIDGASIFMEIYLPAGMTTTQAPVIRRIKTSHLWAAAGNGFKRLADIGQSGACNIDAACQTPWRTVNKSEAKITFQSGGGSFLCSGTLINDLNTTTNVPYFLTARHCISTSAAASSITAFWNFQKTTCGGANPTTVQQQTGGTALLRVSATEDMTLLRFNTAPPGGLFMAGWSTAAAVTNTNATGIHHPSGDLKKISNGRTAASYYNVSMTGTTYSSTANAAGHWLQIQWANGTTEGGSSGSGLFRDSDQRLIGTLSGGGASCANPTSPDQYGRFALFYPQVRSFLAGTGGTTGGRSVMLAPTPGSTLTSTTTTFRWQNTGATQYFLYVGSARGASNIYRASQGTGTSRAVSRLPSNGSTVFVRLWTRHAGAAWRFNDYTYTSMRGAVNSTMISPTPGSRLTGTTATFTWRNVGAAQYFLFVGTTRGASNIYRASQGTGTSRAVSRLPSNGSTVFVRLWTRHAGAAWRFVDYTYVASSSVSTTLATMISPTAGSTLPATTATFTWRSTGAVQYFLYVGTTRGARNIYSGSQGTGTFRTVSRLPSNGSLVYVRLWTRLSTGWRFNDYTYRAVSGAAAQSYHIVLTWGANPRDLDAHLTGPTANNVTTRFHTYFGRRGNSGTSLDLDDTSSFGPETITIANWFTGTYRFSVHDYSDRASTTSSLLSTSTATARVYSPTGLIATYRVPRAAGTLWTAFEMNKTATGITIVPVNRMSFTSSAATVRSSSASTDSAIIINDAVAK